MLNWNEERRLIRIAKMYYEDQMTQNEISQQLGIYRTTITRLLQKAREHEIVKVSIKGNYTEQVELEQKLLNYFDLEDVIVLPVDKHEKIEERQKNLGEATIDLLVQQLSEDDIVGCSWGSTLGRIVESIGRYRNRQIDFVPLVGGPGNISANQHVNTIIYKLANAFGGKAHFMDAPAILKSKQTRDDFFEIDYLNDVARLWDQVTVAIVGIGASINTSNYVFSGFLDDHDISDLQRNDAVGDICCRFYDSEGNPVMIDINDRTIAIELEQLRQVNCTIGVAESVQKTEAIVAALKGGYLTHLVTNEITASAIIDFISNNQNAYGS